MAGRLQIDEQALRDEVLQRFLRYVKIHTSSDKDVEATPSTPGQWKLAGLLAEELEALGLEAAVTDNCYVCARIPASPRPATPDGASAPASVAFLAHLDTAGEVPGKDVLPQVRDGYDGGVIRLADGVVLDPGADADLAAQKGRTIIHADGRTLLGADDKAGVAAIMAAASYLVAHPELEHGAVEVFFTPDEETGKGLPCFPAERLTSKVCYTVDGGAAGEFEAECFNAWGAVVRFHGKAIHPGHARGVMVNAALMAAHYAAMLPRNESPEATDGYYGYYCLTKVEGDGEAARLELILRDFETAGMARRLAALESFARAVEAQFPGGRVEVDAKRTYVNMRDRIAEAPAVMDDLRKAAAAAGVPFILKPVRGGTDGSRLTEMGIPTPNIFTGGRNFHSRAEWASLEDMAAASRVVIHLALLAGA
ncbi:MAG: peptidase T [Acidobacteriota bacterium]|nr:peptidase T [Acidobacteriota bacterium]